MDSKALANLIFELSLEKRIKREGWRYAGVESPESIGEHSLRTAQIAYFLAQMEGADALKACTIAVFHDMGECRTGDVHKIAERYISKDEEKAVSGQLSPLGKPGSKLFSLWKDYEYARTPEGIISKDADLLELAFTAKEYCEKGHSPALSWIETAGKKLKTSSAKKLFSEMKKTDPYSWWKGLKKL